MRTLICVTTGICFFGFPPRSALADSTDFHANVAGSIFCLRTGADRYVTWYFVSEVQGTGTITSLSTLPEGTADPLTTSKVGETVTWSGVVQAHLGVPSGPTSASFTFTIHWALSDGTSRDTTYSYSVKIRDCALHMSVTFSLFPGSGTVCGDYPVKVDITNAPDSIGGALYRPHVIVTGENSWSEDAGYFFPGDSRTLVVPSRSSSHIVVMVGDETLGNPQPLATYDCPTAPTAGQGRTPSGTKPTDPNLETTVPSASTTLPADMSPSPPSVESASLRGISESRQRPSTTTIVAVVAGVLTFGVASALLLTRHGRRRRIAASPTSMAKDGEDGSLGSSDQP